MMPTLDEIADRDAAILKARDDGGTYAAIGRQFGVSMERVRQIVKKRHKRAAIAAWKARPQSEKDAIAKELCEAYEKDVGRYHYEIEKEIAKRYDIPESFIWGIRHNYRVQQERAEEAAHVATVKRILDEIPNEAPAVMFLAPLCRSEANEGFEWGYDLVGALALIFTARTEPTYWSKGYSLYGHAQDWNKSAALAKVTVGDLRQVWDREFRKYDDGKLLREFRRLVPQTYEQRLEEATDTYKAQVKEIEALTRRLDYANERLWNAHHDLIRLQKERPA